MFTSFRHAWKALKAPGDGGSTPPVPPGASAAASVKDPTPPDGGLSAFAQDMFAELLLWVSTRRAAQSLYRNERFQIAARWIENTVMVRWRERRSSRQTPEQPLRDYLTTHFCESPFTHFETTHTGLAFVCCPIWLPTPLGRLDLGPQNLWTGPTAQKLRRSIIEGSFRYCNHTHCNRITNRTLLPRDGAQAQKLIAEYTAPDKGDTLYPEHVVLAHDKSCNISCPSCRSQLYMADKDRLDALDRLMDHTVYPLLSHAKTVMITGSGDAFGSTHFRKVIRELATSSPALKIDLHTNGQMWDERAWNELKLQGRVRHAHISIDAARPNTYAVVRQPGSFDRLLRNLVFVKQLREAGEIERLEFSMVVQAINFREMPEFVALGERFAADVVSFQMIRQRDLFSLAEYKAQFIGGRDHLDHAEFVEILRRPELTSPRVLMGNVLAYI